ncbi:MAG: hypothetical protein KAR79_03465 [Simkaniaceae bacterium]|nr:hypothetical protein [Simkaniaceae bacterium]
MNSCPKTCKIIEVGAYQCGTTIFMAKFLQRLGKKGKLFAFDTFCGMPAATDKDKKDLAYYDSGMFINNQIQKVQRKIKKEKVDSCIDLIKGDVAKTLLSGNFSETGLDLMLLDTDQYKGTSIGLEAAARLGIPQILVDDTSPFRSKPSN